MSRWKVNLGALFASAALALSSFSPAIAQETADEMYDPDRFMLFADCAPMDIAVESLHADALDIGLTEGSIQVAAESRLRSARLYDSEASEYLYIDVKVFGPAFSTSLRYNKFLLDEFSGTFCPAPL